MGIDDSERRSERHKLGVTSDKRVCVSRNRTESRKLTRHKRRTNYEKGVERFTESETNLSRQRH